MKSYSKKTIILSLISAVITFGSANAENESLMPPPPPNTPKIDLIIEGVWCPPTDFNHSIARGKTFNIPTTVRNNGKDPAPASTVSYYLAPHCPSPGQITPQGTLIGTGSAPIIPGNGGSVKITPTLKIPANMKTGGPYYLVAWADQPPKIAETNEGNNGTCSIMPPCDSGIFVR